MKWLILLIALAIVPLAAEENTLIICENSLETLAWDYEFIDHAEHSIELSSYCMGGEVLSHLLDRIAIRLGSSPRLQVYILCSPILFEEEQESQLRALKEKYPDNFHIQLTANVLHTFPNFLTTENHLKFLVVDEHYFSVGGSNFDEYLCREGTTTPVRRSQESLVRSTIPAGTRDQDIVGRGLIANELRVLFYKIYALWENYEKNQIFESDPELFASNPYYAPIEGDKPLILKFETSEQQISVSSIKVLLGSASDSNNKITAEYEQLILGAQENIAISNLYFAPTGRIFEALLDSCNRDICISLITNGMWGGEVQDSTLYCWPARVRYIPLFYGRSFHFWQKPQRLGIHAKKTQIYEYNVFDVIYHKKIMVVDGSKTLIGSYNFTRKSHKGDFELVLSIDSEEVAARVLQVLERDKSFARGVSVDQAQDWYFDPIISYKAALQEQLLSAIF